jgi:hypothetical protein
MPDRWVRLTVRTDTGEPGIAVCVNLARVDHLDRMGDGSTLVVWQTSSPRAQLRVLDSYDELTSLLMPASVADLHAPF